MIKGELVTSNYVNDMMNKVLLIALLGMEGQNLENEICFFRQIWT